MSSTSRTLEGLSNLFGDVASGLGSLNSNLQQSEMQKLSNDVARSRMAANERQRQLDDEAKAAKEAEQARLAEEKRIADQKKLDDKLFYAAANTTLENIDNMLYDTWDPAKGTGSVGFFQNMTINNKDHNQYQGEWDRKYDEIMNADNLVASYGLTQGQAERFISEYGDSIKKKGNLQISNDVTKSQQAQLATAVQGFTSSAIAKYDNWEDYKKACKEYYDLISDNGNLDITKSYDPSTPTNLVSLADRFVEQRYKEHVDSSITKEGFRTEDALAWSNTMYSEIFDSLYTDIDALIAKRDEMIANGANQEDIDKLNSDIFEYSYYNNVLDSVKSIEKQDGDFEKKVRSYIINRTSEEMNDSDERNTYFLNQVTNATLNGDFISTDDLDAWFSVNGDHKNRFDQETYRNAVKDAQVSNARNGYVKIDSTDTDGEETAVIEPAEEDVSAKFGVAYEQLLAEVKNPNNITQEELTNKINSAYNKGSLTIAGIEDIRDRQDEVVNLSAENVGKLIKFSSAYIDTLIPEGILKNDMKYKLSKAINIEELQGIFLGKSPTDAEIQDYAETLVRNMINKDLAQQSESAITTRKQLNEKVISIDDTADASEILMAYNNGEYAFITDNKLIGEIKTMIATQQSESKKPVDKTTLMDHIAQKYYRVKYDKLTDPFQKNYVAINTLIAVSEASSVEKLIEMFKADEFSNASPFTNYKEVRVHNIGTGILCDNGMLLMHDAMTDRTYMSMVGRGSNAYNSVWNSSGNDASMIYPSDMQTPKEYSIEYGDIEKITGYTQVEIFGKKVGNEIPIKTKSYGIVNGSDLCAMYKNFYNNIRKQQAARREYNRLGGNQI